MASNDRPYRNFDHEMRGHPKRCEGCGAPLQFWDTVRGHTRCVVCVGLARDLQRELRDVRPLGDAELDRPLDPADPEPTPEPPLEYPDLSGVDGRLRDTARYLADAELRHSIQRAEDAARWAWVAWWKALYASDSRYPTPARFHLDPGCMVCCDIINEQLAVYAQRPTRPGYRCFAHSTQTSRQEVAG